MTIVVLVGLIAGTLTTVSFVPQVLKTWRSRSAADLSAEMFITFCSGVALWLLYGILNHDIPVTITNAVTLTLATTILVMKYRYR